MLKQPWLGEVSAFLIIFFAVMVVAWLVGRLARWMMKEAGLTVVDRALGGLLGLLRGSLVVAVVLVAMAAFAPAARWLPGSQLAPYFMVAGRAVIWVAPSDLRHRFDQGLDYLRKARSPSPGTTVSGK
jgi:membrane protein required for colicin V production